MTVTVPCEIVRANALRDALTDALRTGCESVINYAMLLMERDLQLPRGEGGSEAERLPTIIGSPGTATKSDCQGEPLSCVKSPPEILALAGIILPAARSTRGLADLVPDVAPASPSTSQTAPELTPSPGSPESIAQARAYVLARCASGECIDCRIICRLTGWDAPRIRRFVTDTQDELRAGQGVRGRGRPKSR